MKKNVILSFDYELFFGDRSGTVLKTLIEPTRHLLNTMDSVGFKGNFFVDWQMLKYLKAEGTVRTDEDYALIVNQLKDMIRCGHRIELHIHPHWVDAKYKGDGTWDFSEFRHYSLNTFTEEEIVNMFKEGAELLTGIARQVDTNYELAAFRAGGWAVQPFDKISKGMDAVGIKIDSSVMPGIHIFCEHSECDFFNAPYSKPGFYYFSNDVCVEDTRGRFLEIPISRVKRGFFRKIIVRLTDKNKYDFSSLADGTHTREKETTDIWKIKDDKVICTFSYALPLTIPLLCMESKNDILCFIDHPKDINKYTCKSIKLLSYVAESMLYKDFL